MKRANCIKRLVEAEVGSQLRPLLLRRILADHERHRVAGEVEQSERDERDHRHDDEGLQEAAKDEREQEVPASALRNALVTVS
jgi:hypothetical protein